MLLQCFVNFVRLRGQPHMQLASVAAPSWFGFQREGTKERRAGCWSYSFLNRVRVSTPGRQVPPRPQFTRLPYTTPSRSQRKGRGVLCILAFTHVPSTETAFESH